MPGLAGIIANKFGPQHTVAVRRMVDSMMHESFYSSGTSGCDALNVAAGFVAHAGSYADCQPIWNERRDVGLVFSGEHYADASQNAKLRAAGHVFTELDASALVHLYEENPTEFFLTLNGTYCGVLWDLRQRQVVVFNDRYGLGRVYYHQNADGFHFATEAKALLRELPHLRELDPRSMGELLVCGCTLQDRTLFPGISLLPPGSAWVFREGESVRRERYFDPTAWENQSVLPSEEYYEALRDRFDRILPRYFAGKQKVALSVTGGLDSRMIIGIHAKPGELPCYTFGGAHRESEDVKVGRQVATLCQQSYDVIKVDERFFPEFPTLASRCVYISDGTMDVSGSVGLYVNRQARKFGDVRMTGNYGSEILRENVAFKAERVASFAFADDFIPQLPTAAATFHTERNSCRRLSFIAFKQVPWHHYGRFSEEQSQLTIRAPYLDNELVPLAYRAPAEQLLNKELAYRYTTESMPALRNAPTDRGNQNRPKIIPKRLFDLSKELRPRAEYYYDYGMPQWFAKVDRALSPLHLERHFLGQQKYYHFSSWYRHELASTVRSVLLDPRALNRSYLNRKNVETLVDRHTTGRGNYTLELHKLLTLELIQRQLVEA